MKKIFALLTLWLLAGCTGKPMPVIQDFNLDNYLGTWYEIARIDNRFESGLTEVTAQYRRQGDGVQVINRGFSAQSSEWKQAIGKARFVGSANEGRLEVSFFGPFYGDYQILAATKSEDGRYRTALVAGNDLDYLWLLSRERAPAEDELTLFKDKIRSLGIEPDGLVWLSHSPAM
ncbi:lipocalin family protein [Shewanella sp.]|uniref:lipocalin family protein n=1 Tax=Shewanella sp. TaxID=50422 RepID=UPI0035644F91